MDSCPDGMRLTDAQNLEKLRAKRATVPINKPTIKQNGYDRIPRPGEVTVWRERRRSKSPSSYS